MLCAASTCSRALPDARAQRRNRGNVLYDADFVVDVHDDTSTVSGRSAAATCCGIQHAARIRREIGHPPSAALEFPARIEHRLVFGAHRDDMPADLAR